MQAQVRENPLDHRLFENGGDDPELPSAIRAVFEVDLEDSLEQLAKLMRAGRPCAQPDSVAMCCESPVASPDPCGSNALDE